VEIFADGVLSPVTVPIVPSASDRTTASRNGGGILDVSDPSKFVRAVFAAFSGDARVAIEGNFGKVSFSDVSGASVVPTAALRPSTSYPPLEYVILPATSQAAEVVAARLLARPRLVRRIAWVQVEVRGSRVVLAECGPHGVRAFVDVACDDNALAALRSLVAAS